MRDHTVIFGRENAARAFAEAVLIRGTDGSHLGHRAKVTEDPGDEKPWWVTVYYLGGPDKKRDDAIMALAETHGGEWLGCGTYVGGER